MSTALSASTRSASGSFTSCARGRASRTEAPGLASPMRPSAPTSRTPSAACSASRRYCWSRRRSVSITPRSSWPTPASSLTLLPSGGSCEQGRCGPQQQPQQQALERRVGVEAVVVGAAEEGARQLGDPVGFRVAAFVGDLRWRGSSRASRGRRPPRTAGPARGCCPRRSAASCRAGPRRRPPAPASAGSRRRARAPEPAPGGRAGARARRGTRAPARAPPPGTRARPSRASSPGRTAPSRSAPRCPGRRARSRARARAGRRAAACPQAAAAGRRTASGSRPTAASVVCDRPTRSPSRIAPSAGMLPAFGVAVSSTLAVRLAPAHVTGPSSSGSAPP